MLTHEAAGRPRPRRSTSAWRSIRPATAGWPACRWPTWAGSAWWSGRWSTASASTWSAARTRHVVVGAREQLGVDPHLAGADRARPDRRVGLPLDRARRRGRPGGAAGQRRADLRAHRDRRRGGLLARRPAPRRRGAGRRRRGRSCAGPRLLRCYRDGTDPRPPDGWLPTGDLGELGADGLVVRGPARRDDRQRRRERVAHRGRGGARPAPGGAGGRRARPARRGVGPAGRRPRGAGRPGPPSDPRGRCGPRSARSSRPRPRPASSSWWTGSPAPPSGKLLRESLT